MRNINTEQADNGSYASSYGTAMQKKTFTDRARDFVRKIGDPIARAFDGSQPDDNSFLYHHMGDWDPNTEEFYVKGVPMKQPDGTYIPGDQRGMMYNYDNHHDWDAESRANGIERWARKVFGDEFVDHEFASDWVAPENLTRDELYWNNPSNPDAYRYFLKQRDKIYPIADTYDPRFPPAPKVKNPDDPRR